MNNEKILNLPNILSLSRIPLGIVFLILFILISSTEDNTLILTYEIISFITFIIAIITDGLDGYFARKMKIVTDIGKHLDPLTDSIFFIIVFFTFFLVKLMPIYLFLIVLVRELTMHFILRPYFKSKGISLPANIFGKLKTLTQSILSLLILFILILLKLFEIFHINFSFINSENTVLFSFFSFWIIAILSVLSFFTYLFELRKIK